MMNIKRALLALCLLSLSGRPLCAGSDADRPVMKIMPLGDSITEGYQALHHGYRYKLFLRLKDAGHRVDFVGTRSKKNARYDHYPRLDEFDPDHQGYSGITASVLADTLRDELLHRESGRFKVVPDVVLLHIGTNDITRMHPATPADRLTSVPETVAAVGRVIDVLRDANPDVRVFVAQIIPRSPSAPGGFDYNAATRQFNDALPALLEAKRQERSPLHLVDHYTGFDGRPGGSGGDTTDGLHPSVSRGEGKMADAWFEAMLRTQGPEPSAASSRSATDFLLVPFMLLTCARPRSRRTC